MGDKYIKDDILYERTFFGDKEVGRVENGLTGSYVKDNSAFGGVYQVDHKPLGQSTTVTTKHGWDGSSQGFVSRPNPFSHRGVSTQEFTKLGWGHESNSSDSGENGSPGTSLSEGLPNSNYSSNYTDASANSNHRSKSQSVSASEEQFTNLEGIILLLVFLFPILIGLTTIHFSDSIELAYKIICLYYLALVIYLISKLPYHFKIYLKFTLVICLILAPSAALALYFWPDLKLVSFFIIGCALYFLKKCITYLMKRENKRYRKRSELLLWQQYAPAWAKDEDSYRYYKKMYPTLISFTNRGDTKGFEKMLDQIMAERLHLD